MHLLFEILTVWLMLETGAKCVLAWRGGGKMGIGMMGGSGSGGGSGGSYESTATSQAHATSSGGDTHFGAVQISAGSGTNAAGGMSVSKWLLIGLAILIPGGALLAVFLWRKFRK